MTYAADGAAEDFDKQVKKEPGSSKPWLDLLAASAREFETYHDKADNIDKLYSSLEQLANNSRDRQFQLFWANIQVLGPSIYSRPPVPVVVPRFKDRRPLYRTAAELLERATIVAIELEDIDQVMMQVRDDLNIVGRGVIRVRLETKKGKRICIEHVDRRDFRHDPARKWKENDWDGYRAWLTKDEAEKRFKETSGNAYQKLSYAKRKDKDGTDDGRLKAEIWEIWSKSKNRVVWVSDGCEVMLDDDEPHHDLTDFFPGPRPAYATVQRGTLIPVPDMVYYRDQLEEINDLTARIHALGEAVKIKGFYPAGAGEISDAIESAMKSTDDRAMLIGISNWAMFGNGSPKDSIVWFPIVDIVNAIVALIEQRKQLIQDVYEIMGLSDIMRGSTDAKETLGAQELKSQYGSVRIRDKQAELVRIARDTVRIVAEILAEEFDGPTLLEMTQMELPTDAEIKKQVADIKKQALDIQRQFKEAQDDPETQALAQQNPEQAQKIMAQAQQQLDALEQQAAKVGETVTIDQVMKLLRDQKLRPFTLDIETDSTIAPDDNAQKQRATEFVTAVGGFMAQALPLVEQMPQAATLAAETLKFVASQFRAGRQLDQVIDEFADNMKEMASKPKPPSPEQQKAEADAKASMMKAQTDQMNAQADAKAKEAEAQARTLEAQAKAQEAADNQRARQADEDHKAQLRSQEMIHREQKAQLDREALEADQRRAAEKHAQDMELKSLDIAKRQKEIEAIDLNAAATIAMTNANIDANDRKTDAGIAAQQQGLAIKRDAAQQNGAQA